MQIAAVRAQQTRNHPRGVIGIGLRIHRRGRSRKGVKAVVDLKHTVSMAAVADDIASRVTSGPAGFLRRYRREKHGIEPVFSRGLRDLRTKGDACEYVHDALPSRRDHRSAMVTFGALIPRVFYNIAFPALFLALAVTTLVMSIR